MRPAFAGQPVASTLLVTISAIWVLMELREGLHRRPEARTNDRHSLLILRLCITAGILLAFPALQVQPATFGYHPVAFALSLALLLAGAALRMWSFRTLGRYFTFTVMTSSSQPVITRGPYRLVRHPSYTGLLLALAGIGLAFGNYLSLAAVVILPLAAIINRIQVEEAALSTTLGAAYTTYARTRRRLIPLIW